MKIQNQTPVQTAMTRKNQKKNTSGVFQGLLESEIESTSTIEHTAEHASGTPEQQPLQTLHTSIALLDRAMDCLESGQQPPEQLLSDIEKLRNEVRQHSTPNQQAEALQQADTILAVEAVRIRSFNH